MDRQVLVPSVAAYGDGLTFPETIGDINSLTAGALAVIVPNRGASGGTPEIVDITTPGTTEYLTDAKWMQIAIGRSTGAYVSKRVYRNTIVEYEYTAYNAPSAEVLYIGDDTTNAFDLNLPGTLVAGTALEIAIWDATDGQVEGVSRESYSYTLTGSDTQTTAMTALIALINGGDLVTAAAIDLATANAGMSLTGNTAGVRLGVSLGGILVDAPIGTAYNGNATATAADPGQGTYAQVLADYNYARTVEGDTSRNWLSSDLFTVENAPITAETYDAFAFNYTAPATSGPTTVGANGHELVIYVEAGDALVGNLQTIFNIFIDPLASGDEIEVE